MTKNNNRLFLDNVSIWEGKDSCKSLSEGNEKALTLVTSKS